MPRPRNVAATPHKTPIKSANPSSSRIQVLSANHPRANRIPLNDDRREKANRLHNRQAAHEAQLNSIKAAATPIRHRMSLAAGGSPHTPKDGFEAIPSVGGTAVTPMKRVPILANFEEWMKMATDNVHMPPSAFVRG